jgi:hypothetical protein
MLFERGGKREKKSKNIMEGVNLVKVYSTLMGLSQWTLTLLMYDKSKIKVKNFRKKLSKRNRS